MDYSVGSFGNYGWWCLCLNQMLQIFCQQKAHLKLFLIKVGVGDSVTNFVVVFMLLSVLVAIYQNCGFALQFFCSQRLQPTSCNMKLFHSRIEILAMDDYKRLFDYTIT
jgi:hypothetical protein